MARHIPIIKGMNYPTITAQRDADLAVYDQITKTDIPALQDKAAQLWKQHKWLTQEAGPTGYDKDNKAADARRVAKMTDGQIEDAKRQADKRRQEVTRLDLMLNADTELAASCEKRQVASHAQVAATREALVAREHLADLQAAFATEESAATQARAAQRASALSALGFGDKPAESAAAADKALHQAEVRADALREAIQAAHDRITRADDALLVADANTRKAEAAILVAKLHQAQRDHMEAHAAYLAILHRLHGAEVAAGVTGPGVSLYTDANSDHARFEAIAAELRELAERGE